MLPPEASKPAGDRRRIERTFRSALLGDCHFLANQTILVGVSGGPDSTALLLLLQHHIREFGYGLRAAYFDHEIRSPEERSTELAAVRRLAEAVGVPLHLGSADVPALARTHGHSIEEQARMERYGFLASTAKQCGAQVVAVGHTADDQAETILFHLVRGSGVHGLVGMRRLSSWPLGFGPVLVRPVLDLSRADTRLYCHVSGVVPHHDSENDSNRHIRNRIRHEVIPLLECLNPKVRDALVRLGRSAAGHMDFLDASVKAELDRSGPRQTACVTLSRENLLLSPPPVRDEILARAYARATGSRRGLTARHLHGLTSLLDKDGEHQLSLPYRVYARFSGNELQFGRPTAGASSDLDDMTPPEMPLPVPGHARFGAWRLTAELIEPGIAREPGPLCAILDSGVPAPDLSVRTRRPGDRMIPVGMPASKKLQDILVDAKIPRSQRSALPLVCLGDEVIWAVGVRISAEAAVRDSSRRRIALSASLVPSVDHECLDAG